MYELIRQALFHVRIDYADPIPCTNWLGRPYSMYELTYADPYSMYDID